jgi:hypothetical protein
VAGAGPAEVGGGNPSGVEVVDVWVDDLCEVWDAEGDGGGAMVGMEEG